MDFVAGWIPRSLVTRDASEDLSLEHAAHPSTSSGTAPRDVGKPASGAKGYAGIIIIPQVQHGPSDLIIEGHSCVWQRDAIYVASRLTIDPRPRELGVEKHAILGDAELGGVGRYLCHPNRGGYYH